MRREHEDRHRRGRERAASDTTYFVPMVERTAERFAMGKVAADKAYLSRLCTKIRGSTLDVVVDSEQAAISCGRL